METKDVATFVTWGAATGAAILAATVWLIAQHAASLHPLAISTYQFEEFRAAQKELKDQFNERMAKLEMQIRNLEEELKSRSIQPGSYRRRQWDGL